MRVIVHNYLEVDSAYSDFISAGNKPEDWEKYAVEQNRKSREIGEQRVVQKWRSGGVSGNDIVNILRSRGVSVPSALSNSLQHNDTVVSSTNVQGRGIKREEAEKIHRWVSEQMNRLF